MIDLNGRAVKKEPGFRVGLALGGGVARGWAHVGVLSVLEEAGVPIDCVAGTSMGAIIGAAYCAGIDIDGLVDLAERTNWLRFSHFNLTRQGLVSFRKLELWIEDVVGDFDIRDLSIPFAAVASDLIAGERVVLWRGRLAPALRASSSVPGFATPVEWDGQELVDGGVTDNVPGDVARMLGGDYIIGVDVFIPAMRRHLGPMGQGLAALETLVRHAGRGPGECDYMIVPHLEGKSYFQFSEVHELIALGAEETLRQLPHIQAGIEQRRHLFEQASTALGNLPAEATP